MIQLPRGAAVCGYARPVEDVYFVLDGRITVGWGEAGRTFEEGLEAKDAIFNPAGRIHYFRNDGAGDATVMMLVGTAECEKCEVDPMRERAVDVTDVSIVDCAFLNGPRDVLEYPLVATQGRPRSANAGQRDPKKGR